MKLPAVGYSRGAMVFHVKHPWETSMTVLLAFLVLIVLLVGVLWRSHRIERDAGDRVTRAEVAAAEANRKRLDAESDHVASSARTAEVLAGAQKLVEECQARLEAHETGEALLAERSRANESGARADRYFQCIANIERERNEWQLAYERSVLGHASAQSLMLQELSRLATRMEMGKTLLEKPEPDVPAAIRMLNTTVKSKLADVAKAFVAEHEEIPKKILPARTALSAEVPTEPKSA